MTLCRILGKQILQANNAKHYQTVQFLYNAYGHQQHPLQSQTMHTRWIHSSKKIFSNDKTSTNAESHVNNNHETEKAIRQVGQLHHFRENIKTTSEKVQSESGLAMPDIDVHPDVIEARSMQDGGYRLPHPIWTDEELYSVKITHRPPVGKVDKLAYYSVQCLRTTFDIFSGYTLATYTGRLDEKQWVKRIIFLETIAGVPGMVGAMVRHLISLRKFKRDHGWIHTLLEEAENERMHLMTAMRVANPGVIMKSAVVIAQGIFVCGFSLAYLLSPRFCHRFVGYLEEEAVKTYTHCLKEIDEGKLKMWSRMKAPEIAVEYWKLGNDAMMRDVILAIRADEAHHRTVNHTLSTQKSDDPNPYPPGE